jgi:hypothetical protein
MAENSHKIMEATRNALDLAPVQTQFDALLLLLELFVKQVTFLMELPIAPHAPILILL